MEAVCSFTPPAGCMTIIAGDLGSMPVVRLLLLLEIESDRFVALYSGPASRMDPGKVMLTAGRKEICPLQLQVYLLRSIRQTFSR